MGVQFEEEEVSRGEYKGLWGPFKSEVFISGAEEATGGCLSLREEGKSLDQTCTGLCHEEKGVLKVEAARPVRRFPQWLRR